MNKALAITAIVVDDDIVHTKLFAEAYMETSKTNMVHKMELKIQ